MELELHQGCKNPIGMQVKPEKQDNSCVRHTIGALGKPVCHLAVPQEGFAFSLGGVKGGSPEPCAYPADGAYVHCLRVVAAVEQALCLQQHSKPSLQGEKEKQPRPVLSFH